MPFLFAGLSLLSMFMAVDGRGGSGLIAVFGFAGGLVVGIPMVIIGLVLSAKKPRMEKPDTPPSAP
jgi:hypothetical protein